MSMKPDSLGSDGSEGMSIATKTKRRFPRTSEEELIERKRRQYEKDIQEWGCPILRQSDIEEEKIRNERAMERIREFIKNDTRPEYRGHNLRAQDKPKDKPKPVAPRARKRIKKRRRRGAQTSTSIASVNSKDTDIETEDRVVTVGDFETPPFVAVEDFESDAVPLPTTMPREVEVKAEVEVKVKPENKVKSGDQVNPKSEVKPKDEVKTEDNINAEEEEEVKNEDGVKAENEIKEEDETDFDPNFFKLSAGVPN